MATGLTNNFTSGEISEDAWDRTDIQPVAKGCEQALNYVVRVAGPLGKRRGFWRLGDVYDPAASGRLIPFRRSIDDALMLEFGDLVCRVWNNDGSPLTSGGAQVLFATPYAGSDLAGLRYKQVNDVIYFRHSSGLPPRALTRISNTSWTFAACSFSDGPWRPENIDQAFTLSVTGADEHDTNASTTAGSIFVGTVVEINASQPLFDPAQVGAQFRLRENDGSPSVQGWKVGYRPTAGTYAVSVGRVYHCDFQGAHDETVTNPPTQSIGQQSDGGNIWGYRHDGAGIVRIDSVTDAYNASGTVLKTLPFRSGASTTYWAEGAYSDFRGWPRMWPGVREERLVEGATAGNLDFLDMTETAGFVQAVESFTPGLGTGAVVATDAIRRRVGDDGAELLWAATGSYLVIGSASAEYLVTGGLVDEPISPSSVIVKGVSEYGSADVYPARAHKALIHVTRGYQTLRELSVDTNQTAASDDLTVLARHIAERNMVQLAWVPQPDEALWIRLGDNGPRDGACAVMTYHKEQAVRGFASVALPGGYLCEDLVALPGPGRLETLWGIFSRVKDGVSQRHLWMQSQPTDGLFMDCAEFYQGEPVSMVAGLDHFEGETVRVLADGAQPADQVVTDGKITLVTPASTVLVGLGYKSRFKSLKLDTSLGGSLNARQRVTAVKVSLKTALARVGVEIEGKATSYETVSPRTAADVPAMSAKRVIKSCSVAADADYDPRVVVEDDTAYDSVIYSLKLKVAVNG